MSKRKSSPTSTSLSEARARFKQWRRKNPPRSRLPKELWSSAAELAREHGVHRTAKTLGLDYYSLKKRVSADAERGPEFVELLRGVPAASDSGCTVEIEDGSGATLRIRVQGTGIPDLAAIARAFMGGEE